MICEKCGTEINYVLVDIFNHDGSDSERLVNIEELEENAVAFEVNSNWCGFELDTNEMSDTIRCPNCHNFPFKSKEVQPYEIIRVVMFKEATNEPTL